jgi:SAM-dependent methyltransferase
MAPEIALDAIPVLTDSTQLSVLDPMCGSGTVLSAAINRGQRATGVDIDPLAVLMSTVATAPLDTEAMLNVSGDVIAAAMADRGTPLLKDNETERFVDFWFGSAQKDQLTALMNSINRLEDTAVRSALMVAVSRIIITKSPQASLAADTSHSRPHRVLESSDYDVFKGFARSVRSLARLLDARTATGTAQVTRGDSRKLGEVESASMDLAVTSPPYLNALDYMRGHKMALVWFGFSVLELRELRGRSIGSERAPDSVPDERVSELVSYIASDVADDERLPVGTLQRFAGDMIGLATALSRVLKPAAPAILVVGNSTLRGNYIRNDLITQKAFEQSSFTLVGRTEREIPSTSRYMAINVNSATSPITKRMRSEVVMTMQRQS